MDCGFWGSAEAKKKTLEFTVDDEVNNDNDDYNDDGGGNDNDGYDHIVIRCVLGHAWTGRERWFALSSSGSGMR